jgi:hypothetical protein
MLSKDTNHHEVCLLQTLTAPHTTHKNFFNGAETSIEA